MKEYNWREEREKYRPDFRKSETSVVETAAPAHVTKRSFSKWFIVVGIILAAAVIVTGIVLFNSKDSSAKLAEVAEQRKSAVGLVTLTIELQNGKKITEPIGTAWAFSESRFATNAHVANGLKDTLLSFVKQGAIILLAQKHNCKTVEELAKKLGSQAEAEVKAMEQQLASMIKDIRADIIINATQRKSYAITHVQIHKDYGTVGTKFNPDVAALTIDGRHDNCFKLADKETLHSLKSGNPIAFLGFPMERLTGNNVNVDNPIASMQTGTVVAVSDFEMKDAGINGNFLLRHNLPATGGASGSPIFNADGQVVALLFAANVIGQVKENGDVERTPSAAQINFGVRADLLEGVDKEVPLKDFLFK